MAVHPPPGCINLHDLAGNRYRVAHDPAYHAEHGERGRTDDPWLVTIPCQFGHFFPWGGDRVAFSTNGRGSTAKRLAALPFITIEQKADDGITLSFPASHFDEVAQIARPRPRRRLTPEQRAAAAERLAKFQFSAARQAPNLASESPRTHSPEHGAA